MLYSCTGAGAALGRALAVPVVVGGRRNPLVQAAELE